MQSSGEVNVHQGHSGRMRKRDIVNYYGRRMIRKVYQMHFVSNHLFSLCARLVWSLGTLGGVPGNVCLI